jgi:hypothetical protein
MQVQDSRSHRRSRDDRMPMRGPAVMQSDARLGDGAAESAAALRTWVRLHTTQPPSRTPWAPRALRPSGAAGLVVLHGKAAPWFVSDTLAADVEALLASCEAGPPLGSTVGSGSGREASRACTPWWAKGGGEARIDIAWQHGREWGPHLLRYICPVSTRPADVPEGLAAAAPPGGALAGPPRIGALVLPGARLLDHARADVLDGRRRARPVQQPGRLRLNHPQRRPQLPQAGARLPVGRSPMTAILRQTAGLDAMLLSCGIPARR